jgi:tetratricopeptide (TPR) repeat protein
MLVSYNQGPMQQIKNYLNNLLLLSILLISIPAIEAETPYKKTLYNLFINREMFKWGAVINTMEKMNPPVTVDQKLELVSYYYGFIGHMMGKKQYDVVEEYLKKAEDLNNQVLRLSPKNATACSYKGAFMGFHIGLNKLKSVYLGPESRVLMNKAIKLDPNNVTALINKGNVYFYAPGLLGGDKEDAVDLFLKAEKLMEKNKDTDHNWVYLITLTTLAKSYEKLDQLQNAKITYEKALKNEPNYHWVKDDLYPKLLKQMK